jgi:hypothetical protein
MGLRRFVLSLGFRLLRELVPSCVVPSASDITIVIHQ